MRKVFIIFIILLAIVIFASVAFAMFWQNPKLRSDIKIGCKNLNWNKSFCVDAMPDFPEKIGDFSLTQYNKVNWEEECKKINENDICTRSISLKYRTPDETKLIIVAPVFISKGANYFREYESQFKGKEISPNIFELKSKTVLSYKNKMFWRTRDIDMITIGQYAYKKKADGSLKNIQIPQNFSLMDNEVSKFFRGEYPPVSK